MKLFIKKTLCLKGKLASPASKSHSVRGLIFATLAKGKSQLHNLLRADDTKNTINVCKKLGAKIKALKPACHGFCLEVTGAGIPFAAKAKSLFSGNSGITTTFVIPLLGFRKNCNATILLDCGKQMRQRPLRPLVGVVNRLGMEVKPLTKAGWPLSSRFVLQGGHVKIEGLNSQYLSALLIALPCAPKDSKIEVENLHERPYINMTLSWLEDQKIRFKQSKIKNTDIFHIFGGQKYHPFAKIILGDFSSASYLIAVAALIKGKVILDGLDMQDAQGDKALVPLLQQMGAAIAIEKRKLTIEGGKPLKGKIINCGDIPDLLPTLAVIGSYASGKTVLCNIAQARIKETDRLHSMAEGLRQMGARIEEKKDSITIQQSKLHGGRVHGYNDHRTVMALAVAGMLAEGKTEIDTAESVKKTFPDFVRKMKSIGAQIK